MHQELYLQELVDYNINTKSIQWAALALHLTNNSHPQSNDYTIKLNLYVSNI